MNKQAAYNERDVAFRDGVSISREPAEQLAFLLSDLDASTDDYAMRLTDRLLKLAVAQAASDLHLDAVPDGYLVRLRIDGQLCELGCLPQGKQANIAARLKAMSGLLTYRTDLPQEGRMTWQTQNQEARVVTLPTLHGERIVIRLVAANSSHWQLSDLGLEDSILLQHEQALQEPAGIILYTGPVGTGKTTTAYASLRWLLNATGHSSPRRSIVALEDPIECEIPGIAQSQIDPSVGYDWSLGLKTLLRQDPDVIFIGEIRDSHTAQLAFRASMTGQLVISTMHARNPREALVRLTDMQVPSQHLLSSLRLLTCQRLVPTPCGCAGGCQVCHHTTIRGRQLQATVLPPLENELARAIASGRVQDWNEEAREMNL